MNSTYIGLTVVATAWFVAMVVIFVVRGKQTTRKACFFLFVCTTLASAITQYLVSSALLDIERLSAAHLAGVSQLRLEDDAAMVNFVFLPYLEEGAKSRAAKAVGLDLDDLDWEASFRLKTRDILVTLDAVTENAYIRRYYSVWAADVDFYGYQLNIHARQVLKVSDARVRRQNVESYLECLRNASRFLGKFASEMRSRGANDYYRGD